MHKSHTYTDNKADWQTNEATNIQETALLDKNNMRDKQHKNDEMGWKKKNKWIKRNSRLCQDRPRKRWNSEKKCWGFVFDAGKRGVTNTCLPTLNHIAGKEKLRRNILTTDQLFPLSHIPLPSLASPTTTSTTSVSHIFSCRRRVTWRKGSY